MPRKPSYAEIEKQLRVAEHDLSTHAIAVSMLARGIKPDAMESYRYDRGIYTYRLYGAKRADGGILITSFRYPDQAEQIAVHLFDAWTTWVREAGFTEETTLQKIVADKLQIKRSLAFMSE